MSAATVSRGARAFVVASLAWFVCWQAAAVFGAGRRVSVVLGLYGFVLHMVFGKAYALVPSYFDRPLAFPRAPFVQLPLAAGGTAAMALDAAGIVDARAVGTVAWALGCVVFVGALLWSVRDNPLGRETGTADAKAQYRPVDRLANGFVPVVFAYLLAGAGLPVAALLGVPTPIPAIGPPVTHLLAVGTTALLVFALGFRLLPRFLTVAPRRWLAAVVLPAGAVGPALLAVDFGGGAVFQLGGTLVTVALVGFAVAYADVFYRSERRRLGLYTVLLAVTFGLGVGALGFTMAMTGIDPAMADAHARLGLLGFLGLTVVGVSYQFYPPAVATTPHLDDRTATGVVGLLAVGLLLEAGGLLGGSDVFVELGRWLALLGAVLHALVVLAVLRTRG
ncbi:hypothetical protein HWV23_07865 [Natronomonas halophila]|uniref:hypothetical protein n=1 Tax=Natronomonas halophila TaxID=2747817 RepID=UPI0015B5F41A|nr:hypothetical protein [Natronomonas halophila]QLD85644.1 hypothetical protein HWV23_07865 [Natronomonas halophila]